MSKETKEKKEVCCSSDSCACWCCDPKTIAAFLRHLAEFFDKH